MVASNSWEVLWSPNNARKFIRFNTNNASSEIQLYDIFENKESVPAGVSKNQAVKLVDDIYVCQTANRVFPENSSVKSVAWCPKSIASSNCVLAVGQSNGRVSLLNVGQETPFDTGLLLNQEFAPKAERTCHELAWNTQEENLLAVGLDKVRFSNSLLVWDVEAKSSVGQTGGPLDPRVVGSITKKALFEHGSGESTLSVCWVPSMPRTLLAGQGTKWLRLLDMRTSNPKAVATTKAIFGICVDPCNPYRIATYAEGQQGAVLVWDIRHIEKPVVTIDNLDPVLEISWCPTRTHLLAILQKDSTSIKYVDLQYTSSVSSQAYSGNIPEENNHLIERNVQLPQSLKSTFISSFSWHPSHEITMLTVTTTGLLHYLNIFELITMSWSPSLKLILGCGKHMMMCWKEGSHPIEFEDISYKMKERAISGYGESSFMKDQNKLRDVLQDPYLVKLWGWIRRSRKQRDHEAQKTRKFYGVKAILKGELNSLGRLKSSVDEKNEDGDILSRRYHSNDRTLALYLCDWDLNETELVKRLQTIASDGEPERAAAMALFHNKLKLTINILSGTNSKLNKFYTLDPSLPIVAMALSGYSKSRETLWTTNCVKLSSQLQNAYLRAIFAFLTSEDEKFGDVLKETDMELGDRIAFACRYLSDSKLMNYVENLTTNLLSTGSLEGLLLTGLTPDGIDLLENFITKTSDIQTAILIILHAKVNEVFRDTRVVNWIENYRDLLDRWRLWHERAQFDALVQLADGTRKIPQQISVTCTYCNKPVSYNLMAAGAVRGRYFSGGRQNKAMSCPGCRQPLPRCSICLIHMGSFSSHTSRTGTKPKLDKIVNSFQNWFTWCQMCRHGGHAQHLVEWFVEHIECPVTGCSCCCNAQDSVSMVMPQQSKPIDSSEEVPQRR